ncbi:NYN domain-containing protein [Candidatus Parcubacteria bacterium]|nr:NYN domain-containing protein [Patescibacteria group bacterium]MCG2698808.1 NYN domain-containing protein [Candidatus Parcubacteria bacterium]
MFGKEKVAIYIDGSNFYHYLKDKEISFPKGQKFDFRLFVDFLIGDRECISKRYYTGIFRNVDGSFKSQELVKGQQKFLSEIGKDGFIIKRGRIMYDSGKTREKGTDVKIATDLIIGAIDNLYDTAVLVSSDTDLIPAIQYIRYKKKKLEYVGFSHAPSFGIQKYANFSRLLLPADIEKFKAGAEKRS